MEQQKKVGKPLRILGVITAELGGACACSHVSQKVTFTLSAIYYDSPILGAAGCPLVQNQPHNSRHELNQKIKTEGWSGRVLGP